MDRGSDAKGGNHKRESWRAATAQVQEANWILVCANEHFFLQINDKFQRFLKF